jgi:hypothetical protein
MEKLQKIAKSLPLTWGESGAAWYYSFCQTEIHYIKAIKNHLVVDSARFIAAENKNIDEDFSRDALSGSHKLSTFTKMRDCKT